MKIHIKSYDSKALAFLEKQGYHIMREHYPRIPQRYFYSKISKNNYLFAYKNICIDSNITIAQAIDDDVDFDLTSLFAHMAQSTNKHMAVRASQGGSRLFYYDRLYRLSPALKLDYDNWVKNHQHVIVNNHRATIDPALINRIESSADEFQYGICSVSQGDLHERNIFTDGSIIDFEGVGWNLLATDVATFIWHTLFAGNHFGPQYAKWSNEVTKGNHNRKEKQLCISDDGVIFLKLTSQRQKLVHQYLKYFVNNITLEQSMHSEIAYAIAFRLLTTFSVLNMSVEDRHMSYVLANFIMVNNEKSLDDVLELLGVNKIVYSK